MIKKIFFIALIGASTVALAAQMTSKTTSKIKPKGYFVEVNIGQGKLDQEVKIKNTDGTTRDSSKTDNTGVGGSLAAGYKFNQYFGLETGLNYYPDTDYGEAKSSSNFAIPVAIKAIVPFDNSGLSFFGKLGAVWVHHHMTASEGYTMSNEGINTAVTPYAGVGVGYAIDPGWEITLQSTRTAKADHDKIPAMQLVTLGMTLTY